ncbi:MAG: riboflavin synthase [Bacteroidetes bacterium]|nr:MAG: riboflavin synthase [Bacteroidota bacterium]
MFTGIIELLGEIKTLKDEGSNRTFEIEAEFDEAIRVDQSISHDGVCLTVTAIQTLEGGKVRYSVTAIEETLQKTRLGEWKAGDKVNIERSLKVGARLDGHFVQGHVDATGQVEDISDRDGSWVIRFQSGEAFAHLLVDKGSICVNGVSLTVVHAWESGFSVAIIPFTWTHTNFHALKAGDRVNLEFDILGKYISKLMGNR